MDNKKRIVNLEYFREMLHICPRLHGQTFDELSFEEEILAFLRFLSHSREIRKLTDVNINKLHKPWRSFAGVINKCLCGKSTGYKSLRLSQAQILWGMYHKKNVDFAYLLWEDFIYQVEHKDAKKSNEMYYPRFTKVIIHFFMTKDPSIPRRNKITQQFGVMLPVELTNEDIKNSEAYKEYYAIASGAAPPKTKASVKKTKSSFDTAITPLTAAGTRLSTSAKDEGTGIISGVPNVPTDESDEEISWKSSDEDDDDQDDDDQNDDDQDDNDDDQDTNNDGDDFVHPKLSIHEEEAKDGESFDPIVQTPENSDDEGNDNDSLGLMLAVKKDRMQRVTMKNCIETSTSIWKVKIPDACIDSLFVKTPRVDVQASTTVAPLTLTAPTLPPPIIPTISQVPQEPTPPTTDPIKVSIQIQSDRLRDKAQAKNEEFLNILDENIQKIIKEQVKEQVKVQVFKILSKIKKTVNEQLEAEVLIRSSNSSKTSYAVAADLSKMELKKILIEKIESNKSIHRSDEQRNLYKALVDAYECEKIILDTYGNTITLKRPRDDVDKDEEPSAGSDRGSKRQREGKDPESTSAPKEKATKTTGKSTQGSKSHQKTASESTPAEEPMQTTQDLEEPSHQDNKGNLQLLIVLGTRLYQLLTEAFNRQRYPHNLLKPLPLIPNSRGRRVIHFDHFINNDLEYPRGGASSRKYTTSITKTKAVDYRHLKWIKDLFYRFTVNRDSDLDVYSKRRIIDVTEHQIVKWHDYKHLDWITLRRDDDKLYKFKEGVESYQKKLNLTKLDTYHSDLKRKESYIAYSNPRGFIYQNKDKLYRLMRIDELHKFSDGTLNDVRTALDDRLNGIRMKYLP
nr:hypothetical protein [Tanacetum cinerariifolium]